MIYTFYAHCISYVFKLGGGWWYLGIATVNVSMFYMELSFKTTKSLVMCDEYFGAMELELMISGIFFLAGIFGTDGLHMPVCVHMHPDIMWYHFIMIGFICLNMSFVYEALVNSFKANPGKTFRYGLIPLTTFAISVFHASLMPESFTNQFAVFHVLHSFSLNISTFKLMVANMTNQEFFPIGI